jgi:hypothetical protein
MAKKRIEVIPLHTISSTPSTMNEGSINFALVNSKEKKELKTLLTK